GLATIRCYSEIPRFVRDNKYYIDLENRALFLTVTNQRWLAVRLDALGSVLVFVVTYICVCKARSVMMLSASSGARLTKFVASLTQMFAVTTRLSVEVENYLNSVERGMFDVDRLTPCLMIRLSVVHSARGDLGEIEFKNVTMAYRPGLPNMLHGISLQVKPSEKIGEAGRTGAGRSSLTLPPFVSLGLAKLFAALISGNLVWLTDLRSNIAIIPQEVRSGTVRTALDPFSKYDDARLWGALRRSYLVETRPSAPDSQHRLTLDTVIETDGANLSVGEQNLLSLARALVKDCRVVILDEATASVDLETDKKIQQTIQTQFKDRTLICIAHRLRTIISYDRIVGKCSSNSSLRY
ncbi:P-loop containing nucleoside triphosphate hydrolase protein, partial [Mycena sanguinolenta]